MSTRFNRHEIVTYYLRLHDSGLNDSHSGNISGRKEQAFWITPSGAGAETLAAADLIKCPVDGPLPALRWTALFIRRSTALFPRPVP